MAGRERERQRGGWERDERMMGKKTFLPLICFPNECHVCNFNGKLNGVPLGLTE